jgi:hypothetical protein
MALIACTANPDRRTEDHRSHLQQPSFLRVPRVPR